MSEKNKNFRALEMPLYKLCKVADERAAEYLLRFVEENQLVELPDFPEEDLPAGYEPATATAPLSVGQLRRRLRETYGMGTRFYHLPIVAGRAQSRVVLLTRDDEWFRYADATEFLRQLKAGTELTDSLGGAS